MGSRSPSSFRGTNHLLILVNVGVRTLLVLHFGIFGTRRSGSCRKLRQRHQLPPVVSPTHKIRLPDTDMCLPLDDFRMLADNEVVRYFPVPILLAVPFTTFLHPGNTQLLVQVATMFFVLPDVLVNPLVAATSADARGGILKPSGIFGNAPRASSWAKAKALRVAPAAACRHPAAAEWAPAHRGAKAPTGPCADRRPPAGPARRRSLPSSACSQGSPPARA